MNEQLLISLVNKQYFQAGTMVGTTYRGRDISGLMINDFDHEFQVTKIGVSRKTGLLRIRAKSFDTGQVILVGSRDISTLDGMSPERFAQNYLISPNGDELSPTAKRRGRKPRDWDEDDDDFYA